jgi:hypothetical protein
LLNYYYRDNDDDYVDEESDDAAAPADADAAAFFLLRLIPILFCGRTCLSLFYSPVALQLYSDEERQPEPLEAVELPGWGPVVPQAALNLDGDKAPVILNLAGLGCSRDKLRRASLLHMASTFRLMQLVRTQVPQNRSSLVACTSLSYLS